MRRNRCQAVAPSMMERRRGRIVTLSSVAAFKGRDRSAIYATSKAAVADPAHHDAYMRVWSALLPLDDR